MDDNNELYSSSSKIGFKKTKQSSKQILSSKYDIINDYEINKIREKLDVLSPQKLIDDILQNTKKSSSNVLSANLDRKDIFLENLKATSVANFIENIKNKNAKEITAEFEKKIEDYNLSTKLYRDKKDKEMVEFINQIEIYKTKMQELELAKAQLNEKNKKLEDDKKEKEDQIYKLQTKFVIFDKLKPTFEEFFKEYPDEDPKKIIEDIKRKREGAVRIMEDINEMREKLNQAKKDKSEGNEKNRKLIEDLSEKLLRAETNNKDKVERYVEDINILKMENNSLRVYKDENVKLQKMLFALYNKLIERLALDRNINLDPSLKCIEKDFKPDLIDNNEIAQYIKTMIIDSHEETSGKLLRETIAYANMMCRTHLRSKINKRFDPVALFKEVKELLDKKGEKIKEQEKEKELLKEKITKFELELKKISREIKYKQIQYEALEKKFEEQFNEKLSKSKKNRMDKQNRNKDSNQKPANIQQTITSEDELEYSSYEKEKIPRKEPEYLNRPNLTEENGNIKNDKIRSKSAYPLVKADNLDKAEKDTFITNKKDGKISRAVSTRKSQKETVKTVRPKTSAMIYQRPKNTLTLFKYNRTDGRNTDSAPVMTESKLDDTNAINFKQLNFSKNKDKLTKPGPLHNFPINAEGFASLIEHTNKMFLYKAKMNGSNSSNSNIFKKFQNNMESNFKKLDKLKKQTDDQDYEFDFGKKVLSNLNGLIKNLEKND